MNAAGNERPLLDRWDEYERLRREGESYAALVRLAEIANYLGAGKASPKLTRKWGQRMAEVQFSSDLLQKATAEAKRHFERLMRMLNVGTTFTYEELVLAVTLRVELDLLESFLRDHGVNLQLDIRSSDEELFRIARSKENQAAFRSARVAATRNWGISITSEWL